jgi:hypothetical protein
VSAKNTHHRKVTLTEPEFRQYVRNAYVSGRLAERNARYSSTGEVEKRIAADADALVLHKLDEITQARRWT